MESEVPSIVTKAEIELSLTNPKDESSKPEAIVEKPTTEQQESSDVNNQQVDDIAELNNDGKMSAGTETEHSSVLTARPESLSGVGSAIIEGHSDLSGENVLTGNSTTISRPDLRPAQLVWTLDTLILIIITILVAWIVFRFVK